MIKNLFLINNKKITIFREHNNKIETIGREGEKAFEIFQDFWEWWKDIVGYSEGELLDICYVWDEESKIIFQSNFFKTSQKDSMWTQDLVYQVLSQFGLKDFVLLLENDSPNTEQKNIFFTSISKNHKINLSKSQEINFNSCVNRNETEAQKYYRQLREQEKQERKNDKRK